LYTRPAWLKIEKSVLHAKLTSFPATKAPENAVSPINPVRAVAYLLIINYCKSAMTFSNAYLSL
jgi:hypothetical protein